MSRSFYNPAFKPNAVVRDDRGLSTVEYVIILVLIAAAAVVAWQMFGGMIMGKIHVSDATIRNMAGEIQSGQGNFEAGQSNGKSNQKEPAGGPPAAGEKRKVANKTDD